MYTYPTLLLQYRRKHRCYHGCCGIIQTIQSVFGITIPPGAPLSQAVYQLDRSTTEECSTMARYSIIGASTKAGIGDKLIFITVVYVSPQRHACGRPTAHTVSRIFHPSYLARTSSKTAVCAFFLPICGWLCTRVRTASILVAILAIKKMSS